MNEIDEYIYTKSNPKYVKSSRILKNTASTLDLKTAMNISSMDFKSISYSFLKKQKKNANLTLSNKEYLENLVDDLNFKHNAINYHIKRIAEVKEELKKLARKKCEINQKKVSQNDTEIEALITNLEEGINGKTSFSTPKIFISHSEEIDSSKLFFEFESLLFEISSFIDFSFKILKIFFPKIKTRKSKIIASVSKNYPDSELKEYIIKQFEDWIKELLIYRDHIAHLSSLNSNIVAKVSNNPSHGSISQKDGNTSISVYLESNLPEIKPIYLPLKPDYKHKIIEKLEDRDINYEEDFYIFEDYERKLIDAFEKYTLNIFNKMQ